MGRSGKNHFTLLRFITYVKICFSLFCRIGIRLQAVSQFFLCNIPYLRTLFTNMHRSRPHTFCLKTPPPATTSLPPPATNSPPRHHGERSCVCRACIPSVNIAFQNQLFFPAYWESDVELFAIFFEYWGLCEVFFPVVRTGLLFLPRGNCNNYLGSVRGIFTVAAEAIPYV